MKYNNNIHNKQRTTIYIENAEVSGNRKVKEIGKGERGKKTVVYE